MYKPLLFIIVLAVPAYAADNYSAQRQAMVDEIQETVRYTSEHIGKQALDVRVMAAMQKVPRHEFVPATMRAYAYLNQPLPIGNNQTISQPYSVALMTDLAGINKDSTAGSGHGFRLSGRGAGRTGTPCLQYRNY